jgi:DNA-binding Lrp family transcriptional regulator
MFENFNTVKENDIPILASLRQDARMKLTEMSRLTRIPVSTIFDKIKNHEDGIIKKHTTLVDFNKLGFHTKAKIMLKVNKKDRDRIKEHLMNCQSTNSLYKINNGFDFMVEAIFCNIQEMEDFIDSIEDEFQIKSKQVYYIIEDLKREDFLSNPKKVLICCGGKNARKRD